MHKSSTSTPDEARRCLDLPRKDGGDRIYFNGSNIAVEDAGAQYGTNGSENTADRQQENTKALLRLAESIENAAGCGIMVSDKRWVTINGNHVYIGEDGGTDCSAKGKNIFVRGFKNKQALNNHWQNGRTHQEEYAEDGITTKQQYEARALELAQSPCSDTILGYKNALGEIVRYDTDKNDFVKGNPNRNIKTLFKPEEKMIYFERMRKAEAVEDE